MKENQREWSKWLLAHTECEKLLLAIRNLRRRASQYKRHSLLALLLGRWKTSISFWQRSLFSYFGNATRTSPSLTRPSNVHKEVELKVFDPQRRNAIMMILTGRALAREGVSLEDIITNEHLLSDGNALPGYATTIV